MIPTIIILRPIQVLYENVPKDRCETRTSFRRMNEWCLCQFISRIDDFVLQVRHLRYLLNNSNSKHLLQTGKIMGSV